MKKAIATLLTLMLSISCFVPIASATEVDGLCHDINCQAHVSDVMQIVTINEGEHSHAASEEVCFHIPLIDGRYRSYSVWGDTHFDPHSVKCYRTLYWVEYCGNCNQAVSNWTEQVSLH